MAIHKFKAHPSILKIKEVIGDKSVQNEFNFVNIEVQDIDKEFTKLNVKKATTYKNIPAKILKDNSDVCSPYLKNIFNQSFNNGTFPKNLKIAVVLPIFKTTDTTLRIITDQSVFYQQYLRYLKELFRAK